MKKLILLCLLSTAAAQTVPTASGIGYYNPGGTPPVTFSITMTANGAGTGSVADNVSQLNCSWNGSATSGTCTANYNSGTVITLTPTVTGGSTFAWGTNTLGCSGTGSCLVTVIANGTMVAHFSPAGGGNTIPANNFGIGINGGFPTIPFGYMRDWDTCGAEWNYIARCGNATSCTANDASLTYNWTTSCSATNGFDTWSADAFNGGVKNTMVTLASRTPWFATSNTSDTSCAYSCATGETLQSNGQCKANATGAINFAHSAGQCDPPTDLNSTGTGTDLYFRYWVKNFGQHVTNATWLLTHAPVTHLEPHNEPDTTTFSKATFDAQGRQKIDLAQLYVGDANWHFTLTAVTTGCQYTVSNWGTGNPTGAVDTNFKPNGYYEKYHVNITGFVNGANNKTNGTITASDGTHFTIGAGGCTSETHAGDSLIVNTYTGETAAQTQATVGLGAALNTAANTMTGSYHPQNLATSLNSKMDCELYCKNPQNSCNTGNSCTTGGTSFFDQIINIHVKQGNDTPKTLENDSDNSQANVVAALAVQDQAKAVFNPEAAYSASGWADDGCDPVASCGPPYTNYTDAGMQASFIMREYIYPAFLGWQNTVWYNWKNTLGSTLANNAYTAIYNEMLGSTAPSCTQSAPGTAGGSNATNNAVHAYTCTYTDANSRSSAFIWDNSQYCSGNGTSATSASCVATTQTVGNSYLHWIPLVQMTIAGTTYPAGTPVSISSHQIPVSVVPVKLATN